MLTLGKRQTTSVLQTFFLAMAINPHIARKAQEELDRVIGGDRLPDLSDMEDLPYISALIKELLRWGCPTPIGIPKRVMEDDIYNGYLIPSGTTVIENIWYVVHASDRYRYLPTTHKKSCRAIFFDESTYPAPRTFNPERYLKDGKLDGSIQDPEDRIFGSGRRYAFLYQVPGLRRLAPADCIEISHPPVCLQGLPWKTFCSPNPFPQHRLYPFHLQH